MANTVGRGLTAYDAQQFEQEKASQYAESMTGKQRAERYATDHCSVGIEARHEGLTEVLQEALKSAFNLNERLSLIRDSLTGSVPSCVDGNAKTCAQPTILDIARALRGAVSSAHASLDQIERAL